MTRPAPTPPTEHPAYAGSVEVVRTLRAAGHAAYLAGGCVRDMVLGLAPKDFDIATSAPPAAVQALFPNTVPVGVAFGVVLVVHQGTPYEVATFRADGAYHDGRRPSSVDFAADARADVERRDFTLNALLYDPDTGAVIDHVGGQDDISAEVIRAVGDPDRRFGEDRLRMLRAVRFACRFGFTIDVATRQAAAKHAPEIHDVSAERIRDELEGMFMSPAPQRALELLHDTALLPHVLPEVAALRGVAQPPDLHPEGDVFTHTLMILGRLPAERSPVLTWAALLHDIGKPSTAGSKNGRITFFRHEQVGADMAALLADRLRFSNELRDGVVALVRDHMRFFTATQMRPSTLKRFLRSDRFDEKLALHLADVQAGSGDVTAWTFCRTQLAALQPAELRPAPLLRGDAVIALGVERGPRVGEILRAVEDAQLDGAISTRQEALALARKLIDAG